MWTLAQANAALFEIQGLLREAKSLLAKHNAAPSAETEEALIACLEGFEAQNIHVKRIEPGLLDFPSMLGNREVLLCWVEGEKEIGHYHDLEGGFAGRKPLPQIKL